MLLLWIAFKIVFLLCIRSPTFFISLSFTVVNCFQNCIFTLHSQCLMLTDEQVICCELLSKLYFYFAFAVLWSSKISDLLLWIAFKIVFLLCIRSFWRMPLNTLPVVNCFQNCIFTLHSQLVFSLGHYLGSCELLSKLYFYFAFAVYK